MRLLLFFLHTLQVAAVVKTSTFTKEKCKTKLGLFSLEDVPTTVEIIKETVTTSKHKKGKCPVTTVTISDEAITTTVTDTTSTFITITTANTTTETRFNTDTITETDITTTTVTTTVTENSVTVSTPTSTVTPPSGFVPITQETGYIPRKRRSVEEPKPSKYPKSVTCVKTIKKIICDCVKKPCHHTRTSTVEIPATTSTVRTTTTNTSTVTIFSGLVTSTVTSTVTTTETTSTTETETETDTTTIISTSIAPEVTFYAACDRNNIVNSANGGQGIDSLDSEKSGQLTSDTDDYNCCVSCQKTENCAGFHSFFRFDTGNYQCVNEIGSVCNPGSQDGLVFYTDPDEFIFTLGNGPCGQIKNGGQNPNN